ncbi:MAG: hypothetical protein L0Z62_33125 [Gemmataceae bacterium]|nr:hypothetical protein [Gemmataceae bacterium]
MPRRRPPIPTPPPEPPRPLVRLPVRLLVKVGALLLGLGLFLAGLVALRHFAVEQIREDDRYSLPFAGIECDPPPELSRAEFLEEVQYLGRLPERLRVLDDDLPEQLARAFALHPWVARVERVEVTRGCRVRVRLTHRRPALAVWVGERLRGVDDEGVLLPGKAPTAGLPVFEGQAPPPAGPAGTRWGDAAVEKAARTVAGRSGPGPG